MFLFLQHPLYQNIKKWLNYPFSPLIFLILMFPGLKHFFRFLLRFESRNKIFNDIQDHIRGIIGYRRSTPEVCKTMPNCEEIVNVLHFRNT